MGCDLGMVVAAIEDDSGALASELVLVDVQRMEVLSAPIGLP